MNKITSHEDATASLFPLDFNLASEAQHAPAAPKPRTETASLFPVDAVRSTPPTKLDRHNTGSVNDQPQARFESVGPAALSDSELLSIVLGHSSVDSARRILSTAGSMSELSRWTAQEFADHGISENKAAQLSVLPEIARRLMTPPASERPMMDRSHKIAAHMQPIAAGLEVEKFWVLCLNRKNRLIKAVEVSSGTATAALAHPREVFRAAIRHNSTAIICVHNHPSGDPAPSSADLHLTRQLREAAKAIDIDLIDHVIIGRQPADPMNKGFYSFREAGLL